MQTCLCPLKWLNNKPKQNRNNNVTLLWVCVLSMCNWILLVTYTTETKERNITLCSPTVLVYYKTEIMIQHRKNRSVVNRTIPSHIAEYLTECGLFCTSSESYWQIYIDGPILKHASIFCISHTVTVQTRHNVRLYKTIFRTMKTFKKINGGASRGGAQS